MNNEIPKRCVVIVDPGLHVELKALADVKEQTLKVVVNNLLRKGIDDIERESEEQGLDNRD
jgi:hypothetical protein